MAHLYGLTEKEFTIILNAMPFMAQEVRTQALSLYHDYARAVARV